MGIQKIKKEQRKLPPPPPPKQNKTKITPVIIMKKEENVLNEEQISECPDWINLQVCDSFKSCPYFHDGVECNTWVEYGKCDEKDNEDSQCKNMHHRSIWIQDNKCKAIKQSQSVNVSKTKKKKSSKKKSSKK